MLPIASLRNSCGSLRRCRQFGAEVADQLLLRSHPNSLTIWHKFAIEIRLSGNPRK